MITTSANKKEARIQIFILWWLRAIVALAIAWGLLNGEWEVFFISIVSLGLTFTPEVIKKKYNILLPIEFDMIIVGFIIAAVFLGEVGDTYEKFWWWDGVLHFISGAILAFAGYLALYTLYHQGKLKGVSPLLIAVFTFSFGLALGALWEIFEFVVDQNFGTNMQKNGLHDTMWDLIVDAIGALIVAYLGYRLLVNEEKRGLFGKPIDRFLKANPQLKRRHMWKD